MIEIEDDGAGIDANALIERALELGKLGATDVTELSRSDILGLNPSCPA